MSELFEDNQEQDESIEIVDDFDEIEIDTEIKEPPATTLDARRRLEQMLEEKRLKDELDDFLDE